MVMLTCMVLNITMFLLLRAVFVVEMSCRFYTDDANTGNTHRAAGMTIELRDTGAYGFELPPSQVHATYRLGN